MGEAKSKVIDLSANGSSNSCYHEQFPALTCKAILSWHEILEALKCYRHESPCTFSRYGHPPRQILTPDNWPLPRSKLMLLFELCYFSHPQSVSPQYKTTSGNRGGNRRQDIGDTETEPIIANEMPDWVRGFDGIGSIWSKTQEKSGEKAYSERRIDLGYLSSFGGCNLDLDSLLRRPLFLSAVKFYPSVSKC